MYEIGITILCLVSMIFLYVASEILNSLAILKNVANLKNNRGKRMCNVILCCRYKEQKQGLNFNLKQEPANETTNNIDLFSLATQSWI